MLTSPASGRTVECPSADVPLPSAEGTPLGCDVEAPPATLPSATLAVVVCPHVGADETLLRHPVVSVASAPTGTTGLGLSSAMRPVRSSPLARTLDVNEPLRVPSEP